MDLPKEEADKKEKNRKKGNKENPKIPRAEGLEANNSGQGSPKSCSKRKGDNNRGPTSKKASKIKRENQMSPKHSSNKDKGSPHTKQRSYSVIQPPSWDVPQRWVMGKQPNQQLALPLPTTSNISSKETPFLDTFTISKIKEKSSIGEARMNQTNDLPRQKTEDLSNSPDLYHNARRVTSPKILKGSTKGRFISDGSPHDGNNPTISNPILHSQNKHLRLSVSEEDDRSFSWEEEDEDEAPIEENLFTQSPNGFLDYYESRLFADVVLVLPDKTEFFVHKLLLAYSSQYFFKLFINQPADENELSQASQEEPSKVELSFTGPTEVFEIMIKFLYKGDIKIT